MTRKPAFWLIILTMCMQASAFAQSSAFTYQGKLADGGNAASGQYDFQFQLFDALSGGTQQGSMQTVSNVAATAGIFTVQLDFGACPTCFNGSPRFLEIAVEANEWLDLHDAESAPANHRHALGDSQPERDVG